MPDAAEDALLGGRVRLLQAPHGHRAGTDAVLLAALVSPRSGESLVDVGAGSGAVGLMIGVRAEAARLTLVERDPELAGLCRRNLSLNGLSGLVVEADILDRATWPSAGLLSGGADRVVTNPPFLEAGRSRASPDAARAAAHVLPEGGTRAWLAACAALLRPNGTLALIHRADALAACLAALERAFGGLVLHFVHPRADAPATRLLLTAVKGSRAPVVVRTPLVLHEAGGAFTPLTEALHRGEATLA